MWRRSIRTIMEYRESLIYALDHNYTFTTAKHERERESTASNLREWVNGLWIGGKIGVRNSRFVTVTSSRCTSWHASIPIISWSRERKCFWEYVCIETARFSLCKLAVHDCETIISDIVQTESKWLRIICFAIMDARKAIKVIVLWIYRHLLFAWQ